MIEYTIRRADNGWIVSWWEDDDEKPPVYHSVVFAIPENQPDDTDPESLMELLYFVKENVCGCFYSKHKKVNCMVRMEGAGDE